MLDKKENLMKERQFHGNYTQGKKPTQRKKGAGYLIIAFMALFIVFLLIAILSSCSIPGQTTGKYYGENPVYNLMGDMKAH